MARNLETKLSLIPEGIVMDGFCFSFTLCLLNKLKRLRAEGKIFDQTDITFQCLESISRTVIEHLCKQIHYPTFAQLESGYIKNRVNDLIKVTEEFLEIFVAYPAPLPSPPPSPPNDSRHFERPREIGD